MLATELVPPFPGRWVRREEIEGGLDAAGSLANICYWSEDRGPRGEWDMGITSERPVQYFVRIDKEECS